MLWAVERDWLILPFELNSRAICREDLINAPGAFKIEYDLTVRDPHGNIIQYVYGEDGIDPAKSDHGEAVNIARLVEANQLLTRVKSR